MGCAEVAPGSEEGAGGAGEVDGGCGGAAGEVEVGVVGLGGGLRAVVFLGGRGGCFDGGGRLGLFFPFGGGGGGFG